MLSAGLPWILVHGGPVHVRRSEGGHGDRVLIIGNGRDAKGDWRDVLVIRLGDADAAESFGFQLYRECYAAAHEMRAALPDEGKATA